MRFDHQVSIGALLFLFTAAPPPVGAQIPGVPSASPLAAPKPVEQDPLGRDTPRGCIVGFLRAAERGEYRSAAEYLDMRPSAQAEARARQLQTILNVGLTSDLESLSRAPEGDLKDGLPPTRERVGTAQTTADSLDILLRRVNRTGQPAIWLVASETLQRVPEIAGQIENRTLEHLVPQALREIRIFSIPLYRWIGTVAGIAAALGFAFLGGRLLLPLLRPLVSRMTREQDNRRMLRLRAPLRLIILAAGFHLLSRLSLTVLGRQFWNNLTTAMVICGVAWLVIRISDVVADFAERRLVRRHLETKIAVMALVHRSFKVGIALAGAVALVYASGRDVTAILAGVGLGGLALAFAAQKTLENLFGGVSIISDEAVRVGDFCRFADKCGTVEDIGLRSTRVRTLDRTVLSIPNGQISAMTLENITLRDKFLFNHKFSLRYQTTPAELRGVLSEIREILQTHPNVETADARIRLVGLGESAFTLEVFAYLAAESYPAFLGMQEELLLNILDSIVAGGSGLSYPSQSVYLSRDKPADRSRVEQAALRAHQKRNELPALESTAINRAGNTSR